MNGRVRVSQARSSVESETSVTHRYPCGVLHPGLSATGRRFPSRQGRDPDEHEESPNDRIRAAVLHHQNRLTSSTHRSARCFFRGFISVFGVGEACRRFISPGDTRVRLEPCVRGRRASLSFTSPRDSSCEFLRTFGSSAGIRVSLSPVRTTVQQRASQLHSGKKISVVGYAADSSADSSSDPAG